MIKEKRLKEKKKNRSTSKAMNSYESYDLELQKADAKDRLLEILTIQEKTRSAKKREAAAERREVAVVRRAEARQIAEKENMLLEKRVLPVKVTNAELRRQMEEKELRLREKQERNRRIVSEKEYGMIVDVANTNRENPVIDARSVNDAIAQLGEISVFEEKKCVNKKLLFKSSRWEDEF